MLYDEKNERSLVKRAQNGDAKAFDCLAIHCRSRVFKLVNYIVQNRADAEDVVQMSFVAAYNGLSGFRGESRFFTWISAIAINRARTMLQRRKCNLSSPKYGNDLDDEEGNKFCTHDLTNPENILESWQLADAILGAMNEMRPELASSFSLYEEEGLSYAKIACVMDVPIGTVRRRLYEARIFIARKIATSQSLK